MADASNSSEGSAQTTTRIPGWLRTWWGRVVALIGGVAVIVTVVTGALSITDRFGLTTPLPSTADEPPPDAAPAPSTSAGPVPEANVRYEGGWGRERDTFTTATAAPYAVLNSITDNPAHGDERNFVQARLTDRPNETYDDAILVEPGDLVTIYASVNNDASDQLAGSAATIYGLTAKATVGANSPTDHWVRIDLSGKNAPLVFDGVILASRVPVEITSVGGSAYFHTADDSGGFAVDDPTSGVAVLGVSGADGEFPVGRAANGMELGSGYLTFRLAVRPAP